MPPHLLVDFVDLPPGHGRSVTDFWGWDAHEAQLRCPDDVSGDIGGCSARRTLKPKFYQPTQTMVTAGILSFRENSHGRAGNRTRDPMINSQRLWLLDHEAGHIYIFPMALRPSAGHGLLFLDHIQRRITFGRTSLDEWSARRKYLYLTTQHSAQTDTNAPGGFVPTIPASERP